MNIGVQNWLNDQPAAAAVRRCLLELRAREVDLNSNRTGGVARKKDFHVDRKRYANRIKDSGVARADQMRTHSQKLVHPHRTRDKKQDPGPFRFSCMRASNAMEEFEQGFSLFLEYQMAIQVKREARAYRRGLKIEKSH